MVKLQASTWKFVNNLYCQLFRLKNSEKTTFLGRKLPLRVNIFSLKGKNI